MTGYMPTTEEVRLDYVMAYTNQESSQVLAGLAFDRWLAAHDAAVAAKALRQMHDEMSRWEGWDTRDIGHAFLSESVLDALVDAADRIEGGGPRD